MDERREQSIGESRVRIFFNPSDDSLVAQIKQKAAELIDLCEQHKPTPALQHGEEARCWALAQTCFEDGAMWAVKAATIEH